MIMGVVTVVAYNKQHSNRHNKINPPMFISLPFLAYKLGIQLIQPFVTPAADFELHFK